MAGFQTSTFIQSPPEAVFAFISDPAVGVGLIDGILKCEKLTPGPAGVGTRYLETRLMGGKAAQAELVIRAYEPPRRVTVGSDAPGLVTNYHYTLEPEAGGTHLHWECELKAEGLRSLMLPVLAGIMKLQDGDHLEKVKAHLEGASAGKERSP